MVINFHIYLYHARSEQSTIHGSDLETGFNLGYKSWPGAEVPDQPGLNL